MTSEQLTLTGDPPAVTAEDGQRLGPAQQAVLEQLQQFGRLDDDEAGAILHDRRGRHKRDARCQWCARDGRDVLKSLRTHKLAKEKRGDGWIDPKSLGPAGNVGVAPPGERSRRAPPGVTGPRARSTDPATSHAAAGSVGDLRESQRAVLACFLQHGPMHDEKLEVRYSQQPRQSESGLRTRRRELVDLGLLRDSGSTSLTVHGRKTVVWQLTDQGHQQAQALAGEADDPLEAIGF